MSDDSAERVGAISNSIFREDLKPGDHIYCYGFMAVYHYHGIYIGNDYVIWFSGNASSSKKCSSAYIKKVKLSEFLGGYQLRLMAYDVSYISSIFKGYNFSHTTGSQPADEVIKMAEYFLKNPKPWKNYNTIFYNSASFALYCKIMPDDSNKRVGYFSHSITEDLLRPGDHIYSYRVSGVYSHHGIYIGKEDCEIIHFTGDASTSKSSAFIQKGTLKEFMGDHYLRLVAYNESVLSKMYKWRSSGHILKSRPHYEVIATAEEFLEHPEIWKKYNLLINNCESFACFCKTKWYHLNGQGIGWGVLLVERPPDSELSTTGLDIEEGNTQSLT